MFYFFEPNLLMQTTNNVLAFIAPNILTQFMLTILTVTLAYNTVKSQFERKQLLYLKKTNLKKAKNCNYIIDKNSGKSITYTKVVLWNSGKKRIYRGDIIDDIFQINIREPYKILHAKVIYTNINSQNINNQFPIPPDEKSLSLFQIIEFSCLKPGEGAVIEITHTGKYSQGIQVSGELREHGEIQKADKGIEIWEIVLLALIIYGIAASILVQIFLHYFNLYALKLDEFWTSIIALITVLSMLTLYLYCSFKNSPFYRFLERNMLSIPKDLDDAFNNDHNKF